MVRVKQDWLTCNTDRQKVLKLPMTIFFVFENPAESVMKPLRVYSDAVYKFVMINRGEHSAHLSCLEVP